MLSGLITLSYPHNRRKRRMSKGKRIDLDDLCDWRTVFLLPYYPLYSKNGLINLGEANVFTDE